MNEVPRIHCPTPQTNPVAGRVTWSASKSIWFWANALIAIIGGYLTYSWDAAIVSAILTVITLCLGQSVGLHRLLIHRSFECPWPLELILVYLGSLVGLGGPRKAIYLHEIRDWSQRHPNCHPLFIHSSHPLRDCWWQLNCEVRLDHPPELILKQGVDDRPIYRLMDHFWPLLQLPVAGVLFALGGLPW
ncbi:MAG: acyl-CoA desaturase, partial [Verrucomicrobiota bacterium]